jgi:hypothetical protein
MLLASACDRFGLSLTLYRGQKTFVRGWRSFRGVASLSFTGLRERVVDLKLTMLGTVSPIMLLSKERATDSKQRRRTCADQCKDDTKLAIHSHSAKVC